ncbi:MAG TPA: metallopeptidase family protein [Candidatus Paceibacterota bacterium]|nr:metallopeptidase family protein [Candidatus Paceibacterota bacterium]
MTSEEFKRIMGEELDLVPAQWAARLDNVVFLTADEAEGGDDLLGLYQGVPLTKRDTSYGIGGTMPDTITLYRLPILREAAETGTDPWIIIRETLWHEIAHYFGFEENEVMLREEERTNRFKNRE